MQKETFINYLQYEKRFSTHTIIAYEHDLEQFATFLQDTYSLTSMLEVRHSHIRSWVIDLLQKHLTTRSLRRKLSTLRAYFRFLLKQGDIAQNPMLKVNLPKIGKRLPMYLQTAEINQLLDQMEWGNDYADQRNKLILSLFYHTGMRRAELIGLKLQDIDANARVLKVLGKGNKERLVPFGMELAQQLRQYLEVRQAHFPDNTAPPLFLTNKGAPLYPKLVYNIVNRYLSMVSTIEQRSPHVLRHTFATHLANNGADLNAVKELLGHASLAATQIYTHNSIEKLKQVYQKAHPKAKIE